MPPIARTNANVIRHVYLLKCDLFAILKVKWLVYELIFLDEQFNIITINQYLSPYLDIRKLAVPDLGPPEPFGRTNLFHKFFYRI